MGLQTETVETATHAHHGRRKTTVVTICLVLAVGLVAFGIWAVWFFLTDPYSLEVSGGIAWQDSAINQVYPAGTEFTLTLQNRRKRMLAVAEVVIDGWTDDCGKNMMIREVPAGPYHHFQAYQVLVRTPGDYIISGTVVAPPTGKFDPEQLSWTIVTPVKPSKEAKSLNVKGRVVLLEGKALKTKRIEGFSLKPGSTFQTGSQEYVVQDVWGVNKTEYYEIVLRTANYHMPLKAVRLLDETGKEIKPSENQSVWDECWGLSSMTDVLPAVDEQIVRYVHITAPYGLKTATLEVEYWSQVNKCEIPFTVTVALQRKKATASDPRSIVATEVPIAAWGPKAEDDANDLFELTPLRCHVERGRHPDLETALLVKCKETLTITSYDVLLTGCRDSAGNNLLAGSTPRTALSEGWGVYRSFSCLPDAPRYDTPVFIIFTNRTPSVKAESVTYQGIMRIKVGEEPETVEHKNVRLAKQSDFSVGPVRFTLVERLSDSIEFMTKGDLGLVRRFTVLTPKGKVLRDEKRKEPHLYWTDTYVRYLEGIGEDQAEGLTIKATYLSKSRYYTVPFEVTVPLQRKGETNERQI